MDIKALLLVLCITFASVQGDVPPCCLSTAQVHWRLLKRVEKYFFQSRSGRCDIDALVLHVDGKKLCAPARQLKRLQRLSIMAGQKNF